MKKISIIILSLALSISLAACGRRDKKPATTTAPTTETSMIPGLDPTIMDPTIHTNIPDPEVDTSMPDIIDPSLPGSTDGSDPTGNARRGNR